MRLVITRDIDGFSARVTGFLAQRLERNVMASILVSLQGGGLFGSDAPLFAYALDPDPGNPVVAAAMRTPPWPLIAAGFGHPPDAVELMRAWMAEDPDVGGINAETDTARAVAGAWAQVTGGRTHRRMNEAMHALSAVLEPARPAPGGLRPAHERDRELLIEWERAFTIEAGVGMAQLAPQMVARRLAVGAQFVWEDGGPVSTVAMAPPIAGTVRIGPVYTPRQHRGRGYATGAVAALSRRMLSLDADRCMLFTDLTNPTSNKIYASIGYRRFASWEEHAFIRSQPPLTANAPSPARAGGSQPPLTAEAHAHARGTQSRARLSIPPS
jgi:RimJ/RimL family protein N-acetyltransferase